MAPLLLELLAVGQSCCGSCCLPSHVLEFPSQGSHLLLPIFLLVFSSWRRIRAVCAVDVLPGTGLCIQISASPCLPSPPSVG